MAKIILIGAQGLIGYDIHHFLKEHHQIKPLTRKKVDLTNPNDLIPVLDQDDWQWVIHAAGILDPEACEQEPEKAFTLNADIPSQLANICFQKNIRFLYFSDALVFDGEKLELYNEKDEANPRSTFGKSKLLGEKLVLQHNSDALIVRSSWLYGAKMKNIFKKIWEIYDSQPEMKVVSDYYGQPTWAWQLGFAVDKLIEKNASGIYHAACFGISSWYDYTKKIIELKYGADALDKKPIMEMRGDQITLKSNRPRNSCLDMTKLERLMGQSMPNWEECLSDFYHEQLEEFEKDKKNET